MEKLIKFEYDKYSESVSEKEVNNLLSAGWTVKNITPLRLSNNAAFDKISPCIIVLEKLEL